MASRWFTSDALCGRTEATGPAGEAIKPVGPILCQALDAWQAVRSAQPRFTDRRTGELADLLFAFPAYPRGDYCLAALPESAARCWPPSPWGSG
jgi:hypothetical protein